MQSGIDEDLVKIAVITGSHSNFDLSIVRELATRFSGIIYYATKDRLKAMNIIQTIKRESNLTCLDIRFHSLNVTDLDSIGSLAQHLSKRHGYIDIIISSMPNEYKRNDTDYLLDVFMCTTVFFTGIYYLCQRLFPMLRQNGRVLIVSSRIGTVSEIDNVSLRSTLLDRNLTPLEVLRVMHDYLMACKDNDHKKLGYPTIPLIMVKLCLNLLTSAFQHEFESDPDYVKKNIIINAYSPGLIPNSQYNFGPVNMNKSRRKVANAKTNDRKLQRKLSFINRSAVKIQSIIDLVMLPAEYRGPCGELWGYSANKSNHLVVIDWRARNDTVLDLFRKTPILIRYQIVPSNRIGQLIRNRFKKNNRSQANTEFELD